ncbi:hypothetical protein Srubr_35890 [Streptomyces rubradiris]|uniref:Uncharacterized protein n=1 Tax=Streptomyces rubradiris TaxID=285531 RepID=A0ABQ3RD10_STRRR|nr:hypothetical protein GCM10018792_04810 [Streptomyces rubradiris]GHI53743.1 hypothetical protein Srubr_35890 [Streptomyces rubradiris]
MPVVDGVVLGLDEDVLLVRRPHQVPADQGARRQVEGPAGLGEGGLGRGPFGVRDVPQIAVPHFRAHGGTGGPRAPDAGYPASRFRTRPPPPERPRGLVERRPGRRVAEAAVPSGGLLAPPRTPGLPVPGPSRSPTLPGPRPFRSGIEQRRLTLRQTMCTLRKKSDGLGMSDGVVHGKGVGGMGAFPGKPW